MRGESPRGLDTELYGETNEKDSWGPRSLWPTRRFRVNSWKVGKPEEFRLVLNITDYGVNQDLASTIPPSIPAHQVQITGNLRTGTQLSGLRVRLKKKHQNH